MRTTCGIGGEKGVGHNLKYNQLNNVHMSKTMLYIQKKVIFQIKKPVFMEIGFSNIIKTLGEATTEL